jgi:hypothetical protein
MADTITFEIRATAKGFDIVQKKQKELTKNTEEHGKATDKTTKKSKDYDKQNKSLYQGNLATSKSFSKMNQTIGSGSSGLVGAYATLAANVFAATALFTALRQASQVDQLIEGLDALGRASGNNLRLLGEGIKSASGEAIALDQALRVASVGASASFSGEQLEGLATVARSAAIALGRDVGDAIDRLARGAAKLEPEILDELGIFVRLDDASAKYAASIGKSTSELTRFEQRQAFANEIISQGTEKFSEIGNAVDVSPFDQLAATLSDLGRTFIGFFNTVLGPLAGFLSQNTLALAGLTAMLTKGIITSALPVLNTFAKKASEAAAAAVGSVSATQRAIEQQITSISGGMTRIKGIRGEYAKNFKIIKSGEASTKMLKAANVDLETYILGAQKRIAAGEVKNIGLVQQRIDQANIQIAQNKQLMDLTPKRTAGSGDVKSSKADVKFSGRQEKIFANLDKDPSFKGYKKAFADSFKINKTYRNSIRASGAETKFFGMSLGFLGKPLKSAGAAMAAFGFTSKIAIKGIFTAIPFIGQLLLVLDLLIAGLKKAVGFLGSFGAEATKLETSTKALNAQMKFVAENTNESALAGKSAAEALIVSGNATQELVKRTKEQVEATKESRKETGAFGKLVQGVFSILGFQVTKFMLMFNGLDGIFTRIGIRFSIFAANFMKDFSFVINLAIRGINLLNKNSGIPPIELIDKGEQEERIQKLVKELDNMEKGRERLLSQGSLNIFGQDAGQSEALEAFITQLNTAGRGADELQSFLGTDNINTFASAIAEANSSKSLAGLSPGVQQIITDLGFFNDGVLDSSELVDILTVSLEKGTAATRKNSTEIQSLTETLKNGKEKTAEFFNSFNKKSLFSNFQTQLNAVNADLQNLGKNSENDAAIIQTLGKGLAGSFEDFINNSAQIKPIMEKVNEELDIMKFAGIEITEEIRNEVKAAEGLAEPYKNAFAEAKNLVDEIVRAQLGDAARIKSLQEQEKIVQSIGKGTAAAARQAISLSNQQVAINTSRFQNEIKFQEQTLGLSKGQELSVEQLAKLSQEDQQKYFTLLDLRTQLNSEVTKQISEEEKLAIAGKATVEFQLKALKLTEAQTNAANAQAKATMILSNIEKGRGGTLSAAQQLEIEKKVAGQKIKQAEDEKSLMESRLEFEITIADLRLLANNVDKDARELLLKDLREQLELQTQIAGEKIKVAKEEQKTIGAGNFEGLQSKGTFAAQNDAFDLAKQELNTEAGATTQGKLEIMNEALAPMREQLEALGPEGELISQAQQGIMTLASSFAVLGDKNADAGDKLAAVGSAITAVSAIMAANSKAQVAEIDKQIEAEKRRDGKSKDSIAKIAGMEKKKEQIQRKAFEQKKKMDIASAVISTALGITRALELGPIIGPILAVMQAAMGMAQIAMIKKQQFQGGSSDVATPATAINIGGKRSNRVDVSQSASAGETAYLRGGMGIGSNANNFTGAAMGRKGYANGSDAVVVGERGPEVISPSAPIDITPNYALGKNNSMNLTFNVSALDGASVQEVLTNNQGAVVAAIRDAANSYGQDFLPEVNVGYGGDG